MSESICSVADCGKGGKLSAGLCSTHYGRLWRRGDVNAPDGRKRERVQQTCTAEGCEREMHGHGLCLMHYKRQRNNTPPKVVCVAEGCTRLTRSGGLCAPHENRRAKYGDPLAPTPPRPKRPVKRYRKVFLPGHPLASRSGQVLEHRLVLFGKIGPGAHACHWCGRQVEWRTGSEAIRALVVDHVDHDKSNNAEANLVPSCNGCNGRRLKGETWTPWKLGDPVGRPALMSKCRRGHSLAADNLKVSSGGRRSCRTCARTRRAQAAGIPVREVTR